MNFLLAGATGAAVHRLNAIPGEARTPAALTAALTVWRPTAGVMAAVVILAVARARSVAQRRAEACAAEEDVAVLARSMLVGLSAGLSTRASLELAGRHVAGQLQAEVRRLLRAAVKGGMAEALRNHEGRLERLTMLMARAHLTGASISDAVHGFVAERRDDDRTRSLEAARRLPVKLTVPLALLILPGFVVLTVGPSVLESVQRLLGPLLTVP